MCRGLGLVDAAAGRSAQAVAWLADGRARAVRVAHPYQWIHGWVLDGLCQVGQGDERAPAGSSNSKRWRRAPGCASCSSGLTCTELLEVTGAHATPRASSAPRSTTPAVWAGPA